MSKEPTIEARRAACHDLTRQLRHLIDTLMTTEADEATMVHAVNTISALNSQFDAFEHRSSFEGYAESANAGGEISAHNFEAMASMSEIFDHSPVLGLANPTAPPLSLRLEGNKVLGEATFGGAYEGPPGCVHGGWIAATFDELLGMTQSLSGSAGMTGCLTVNYRLPTPLRVPIRWEGEIVRVEGRKIFTTGRSYVEHRGQWTLTAEAEGLFISIPRERFHQMALDRDESRP